MAISSFDELLSLLWNFPSLAQTTGLDSAKLSFVAGSQASALMAAVGSGEIDPLHPASVALGATPPERARFKVGDTLRFPAEATEPSDAKRSEAEAPAALDKRPAGVAWPVRDQGSRGTCVAFAVTALREHLAYTDTGTMPDLSELFLFWATKKHTADPRPGSDGTWIEFATQALSTQGICDETDWPHNGTPIPGMSRTAASDRRRLPPRTQYQARMGSQTRCGLLGTTGIRPWEPFSVACFIIRNSWGRTWGKNLPSPGNARERGYGQVSASYVDKFPWEFAQS